MRTPKLLEGWLRKMFCRKEVDKGRMLVLWRDVDGLVSGYNVSADNEKSLILISKLIERTKVLKTKRIVGDIEESNGGSNTTSPLDSRGDF